MRSPRSVSVRRGSRVFRGAICFLLFVILVVGILLHRSRFLLGLLFEDGLRDAIYIVEDNFNNDGVGNGTQLIPKIIHQTYKNEDIPENWRAAQKAVKDLHPDFDYMFWTDDSSHAFIAAQYPSFLPTYESYPYPIQRADAIRYFLLYHFGGIYLDLDLSPYRPLTPLLRYPSFACVTMPTGISNDALGSIPNHPFYKQVIGNLRTYNRNWIMPYITIMYSTGPLFLSVMWIEFLSKSGGRVRGGEMDRLRVLVRTETEGDSYGFWNNVQGGSWHGRDVETIFWMGKHWVLVTLLGFIIGFSITGVLWWSLKKLVGFWRGYRGEEWENGAGYKLTELT